MEDAPGVSDRNKTRKHVIVVACGYRWIRRQPNSGVAPNTTNQGPNPAWLVYFPSCQNTYWRKRKDIATLAPKQAPKRALEKLCDATSIPWCRPGYENDLLVGELASSHNKWNSLALTKPLVRIDRYLEQIQTSYNQNKLRGNKLMTWRNFCRWSHTLDLFHGAIIHYADTPPPLRSEEIAAITTTTSITTTATATADNGVFGGTAESADRISALLHGILSKHFDTDPDSSSERLLVVPNCLDDEVVGSLHENAGQGIKIVAMHPDSNRILDCKQRDKRKQIHWMEANFLETWPRNGRIDIKQYRHRICLLLTGNSSIAIQNHCIDAWEANAILIVSQRNQSSSIGQPIPDWEILAESDESSSMSWSLMICQEHGHCKTI